MLRWFKTLLGAPGTPPDAPETAAPTLLVGLPFEMIAVPGHEAVQAWEKLRGRPGQTPVILGGQEDIQPMVESFEGDTKSAQQVLADASQVDPKRWLREQYDADPDLYAVEPAAWPKVPGEQRSLSVHLDVLTQRPKDQVLIALFTGQGPNARDYRRGATIKVEKGVGAKYIELKISDRAVKAQPEFIVKEWE